MKWALRERIRVSKGMEIWLPPSKPLKNKTSKPFINEILPHMPCQPVPGGVPYFHQPVTSISRLATWCASAHNTKRHHSHSILYKSHPGAQHSVMGICLEWCVTEVVLAIKGAQIPKHLQWPRHDRQIQFLGNTWKVYYAFPALTGFNKAKSNDQGASFCPKAWACNQSHKRNLDKLPQHFNLAIKMPPNSLARSPLAVNNCHIVSESHTEMVESGQ